MSTGFGAAATRDLTRVGLTLAPTPALGPRRSGRRRCSSPPRSRRASAPARCCASARPSVVVRAPAAPSAELAPLRQQLEQARMGLRVADARSQELEKQIDALNQKLTESQDELTFFRKAREGKKH